MTSLVYGDDVSVAVDRLPEATVNALLQRAFSHIMGNECAAAHPKDVDGFEAARATWRTAKVAQMLDGTLGTRTGGPRKDPVQAKYDELLAKGLRAKLKAKGLKIVSPKKDEEKFDPFVTFANGTRATVKQLLAGHEKLEGEKIRREAERLVAAEAKATKAAPSQGDASAEEFGIAA